MTTSTSWPERLIPLAWVAGEAALCWVWCAALLGATTDPVVHLPFLGLLVGAAVAVLAGVGLRASIGPAVVRVAALASAGVLGAAAWAVLLRWWVGSGEAATVAAVVVATLVWGRGLWLGATRPTRRHAVRSAVLSSALFVVAVINIGFGLFDFRVGTVATGAMVVLFVTTTTLTLSALRQRELAVAHTGAADDGAGTRPLVVLALPLAALVAGALLVTAVGWAAAGPTSRAVGAAGSRASDVVGGWFDDGTPAAPTTTAPPVVGPSPDDASSPGRIQVPGVLVLIAFMAVAAAGLVVGTAALRHLPLFSRLGRVRGGPRPEPEPEAAEERATVFSWRHLLDQLRAGLATRRGRRRARRHRHGGPADVAPVLPVEAVRLRFREVLVAMRAAGRGRTRTETADELAAREGGRLDVGPARALERLAGLYDEVRYGPDHVDGDPGDEAARAAVAVLEALDDTAAGRGPAPGVGARPSPGRGA